MSRGIGSRVVRWLVVAAMCALPVQGFAGNVNTVDIIDGAVTTPKLADGAVTSSKIVDGAVTDAKISGPISATKIADGVFQKKYGNVVVVAKSGGDFNDPVAAVNSITNASASSPVLVKIMPGTYDLGSATINLTNYVEIEGSGTTATQITSNNNVINYNSQNSSIRNITLSSYGAGIYALNNSIVNLLNVKIAAASGVLISSGSLFADHCEFNINRDSGGGAIFLPYNAGGTARIHNSKIVVPFVGQALVSYNTATEISDCDISVTNSSGGVSAIIGSKITMINSRVMVQGANADSYVIYSDGDCDNKIINSDLTLEVTNGGPNNYNYVISSWGGNYEIRDSKIQLTNTGSSTDYAVSAYGLTMTNSTVSSSGYGIRHAAGVPKEIRNSSVSGNVSAFYNYSFGGLFKVSNTKIVGPTGLQSGDKMINCFDENYNLLTNL